MLIVLGGLPEPQVNYILRELNGDWSQRLDLCYSELKLIIEYDGRHHSDVRANWLKDIKTTGDSRASGLAPDHRHC
jgi:hypothetical protein